METSDDAGVYRLTDELALVQTVDFITPPVDDPYLFGQIAAVNALSDVYAMGGKPLTCMNLVGFPSKDLPPETLKGILLGALNKIQEAGATLVGGHSTDDEEPKFGLSVTGLVHPRHIWRNSTARVGDQLIVTKPIGSGVLFNANRKGWVSHAALDACLKLVSTLNRVPAEVAAPHAPHACTDITGVGLAGHVHHMAKGSGHTFHIELARVPVMAESIEMYRRGETTGVNAANRALVDDDVRFETDLPLWHREIVFDPQTAGPLLFAVEPGCADTLVRELHEHGLPSATRIGEVRPRDSHMIVFA
jgi:selenide,water dikinase